MLNYIWISLLAIGIIVAAGNDFNDDLTNKYRNDHLIEAEVEVTKAPSPLRSSWKGILVLNRERFNAFYDVHSVGEEIRLPITVQVLSDGSSKIILESNDGMPSIWQVMAKNASTKGKLSASLTTLEFDDGGTAAKIQFIFEPIRFVKIKAVTQAAFDYASIAVSIAVGLIGIMALWLGVMKVAEEAGLVKSLTRLLTPLMKRLFPDIPPDHPAVGAMIMNIAANMLGLSNAATPLGLKAMEELNKLNAKLGTATNAMCTFLVINTAGLVLLPATAIAVRAAAGSSNPGIIIGTSIFGATCATIAGLITVKLLEKLPYYKKDLVLSSEKKGGEEHG